MHYTFTMTDANGNTDAEEVAVTQGEYHSALANLAVPGLIPVGGTVTIKRTA